MNVSCYTCHAHMNKSCRRYDIFICVTSCRTYEDAMSAYTNESCHAYEAVMSHIWMSHLTHIEMSHVAHMNAFSNIKKSDVTCINAVLHISKSRITHVNESCHIPMKDSYQTHEEVTSYIWISHVTHQNLTHECTRWGGLWDSVPDLDIGYNTAKYPSAKMELLFSATISTASLHKVAETLRAMQGVDSKDASLARLSPASSGSESCAACPVLIPCDSPLRFWLSQAGVPCTKAAANSRGLARLCNVFTSRNLFVRMISKSAPSSGMSHVTQMNESWALGSHSLQSIREMMKWVTSHANEMCHVWMNPVTYARVLTHTNQSCHTYEWVMSHIWMGHLIRENESCHTLNEPCHICKVCSHSSQSIPAMIPPCPNKVRMPWLIHDSIRVIWLIRQCNVNPFY